MARAAWHLVDVADTLASQRCSCVVEVDDAHGGGGGVLADEEVAVHCGGREEALRS